MLNAIIRFSLKQRLLILGISIALCAYGALLFGVGNWESQRLRIDVLPDLNRPRVTLITDAHGMVPEEVEALITFPLETALNGAIGVLAVRSQSDVGLSVIYVEFDWGTDIYTNRQIVTERIALVAEQLPEGVRPQLAPVSSIMGQIMMVGMWSEGNHTDLMEVRTLADWVVRQNLLTIDGVAQIFSIGGGRKQFQVLVDPHQLLMYGVSLHDVKQAVAESNRNTTGGYLDDQGPNELLVRSLGRIQSVSDLEKVVVKIRERRPVLLKQVSRVIEAPQVKRGDSSAFVRNRDGGFSGGSAVILTINKQPDADTRLVTEAILSMLEELQTLLPDDIRVHPELYQQKEFVDLAINNVTEGLRDGGILVVVILFIFLLNFRTTFITLTAIPLSMVVTAMAFKWFGLSINTMTLGGLAIAIGELVDDAIVDVENIFRRLRENRTCQDPKPALLVVFQASSEIRTSIVFGTLIVVLVFLPLFALGGMEGRLFTPLGTAYIVSILSSLLVSLTLTPVLSYWLLPTSRMTAHTKDALLLKILKILAGGAIRLSLWMPKTILCFAVIGVAIAGFLLSQLERDFLPPFDEGAVQINVLVPPGTSLARSNQIASIVDERLQEIEDVTAFVRRTGRAEHDEHAMGVNQSEIIATLNPASQRSRDEVLDEIRDMLMQVPGIVTDVEQPLQHLMSHMLSGVKAQVGIKIRGDDLNVLRRQAEILKQAVADVNDGVTDLRIEPPGFTIPQLRIQLDRDQLASYGLTAETVNEFVETALNGDVSSHVLLGQRNFDLLVRLDDNYRDDLDVLKRLSIELPEGGTTPLSSVAKVYRSGGPNTIRRESVRRQIVLQCNVSGRGLVDVVQEIQSRITPIEESDSWPDGYTVHYEGQFQSQESASRVIVIVSLLLLIGVFIVLYTMFRSANFSLQVLAALPMAFIGSVAALIVTGQTITIASMVGFISLAGIASRNGILLLNHYLYLVRFEGESWSKEMLVRAGKERLAPILMTALTSGIGLVPLALAAGEPGKEILYPVATVIIGGLITSTALEFIVRPAIFWTFGRSAGQWLSENRPAEFDDQTLMTDG